MAALDTSGWLEIAGQRLEYRWFGPGPEAAPTLVMLHEGLGSADLWGDLPARLAAISGAGVLAYSRAGYGASTTVPLPRPFDYMHTEALDVLPRVLDAVGFRRGVLVGSSDGASIATIHAGGIADPRVLGISLTAPHFIVEDETAAGAAAATLAYELGDLKPKLARWHQDVDAAFYGWNRTWTNPAFRAWSIVEYLRTIRIPVQILQGERDEYATIRQIEIAKQECKGPVEATLLSGVGHTIYRDAPEVTLAALNAFIGRMLRT